jgi:hypothetical protein
MRIATVGLLVAAAASARPALGRCPDEKCSEPAPTVNPWRVAKVNPWRGETPPVAEAPAPQAASDQKQLFQFYIGVFGDTPAPASRPAGQGSSSCDRNCPAGWFIRGTSDGNSLLTPFIISTYSGPYPQPGWASGRCGTPRPGSDGTPTQLTIEDVVRISGRDPVTLAPVPRCCQPPAVSVRVNETRTGQFMLGGAINSNIGISGNVVINESNCELPSCPTRTAVSVPATRTAGNKLHGTWYRELPGAVVAFTFSGDELKATGHVNIDGVSGCVTLTAEYAVSKDGTVHGVITGADATGSGGDLGGLELVSLAVVAQMFVDQPFAFRVKPTGDGLMLSSLRFPAAEPVLEQGPGPKMTGLLCGLYRPAKGGTIPTAKALKTSTNSGPGEPCCDGLLDVLGGLFGRQTGVGVVTLPSLAYPRHAPQYFPPDPPFPLPCELPGQPCVTMPCPVPPGMPCCPPQGCPLPAQPLPSGAIVPCLPPGCVAPPMVAFPQPAPYAVAPPMVAFPQPMPQVVRMEPVVPGRPCYVGEWNRTVGPCTIGLSLSPAQMTAKGVMPVNGEPLRVTLTADCRELRDGLVAGVITSAEVEPVAGKAADHAEIDYGRLRSLVDQPFSCRFQIRGDELIVIDVKVGGEDRLDADDLAVIAGRYAKGEPKWPAGGKGKKGAVSGNPNTGDVIRVGIDFNAPQHAIPFVPGQVVVPGTVAPMFPPEPLPEPPVPEKSKGKGKKKGVVNTYASDPNVRLEQLLRQSEDLVPIGEQRKRIWFNDQPQHLTPERIHGCIK